MKRDLTEEQLRQEVTICLPLSVVLRINDEPKTAPAPAAGVSALPAIGTEYEGGIFAGVTLDGDRLAALVLLPGDFNGTWKEAMDWAEKEDGVLPSRIDQIVLRKNVRGEFKNAWYWSAEQHAELSDYAWSQSFGDGYQYYGYVTNSYRARAVRRVPIQ